jgi:hypothetical protein
MENSDLLSRDGGFLQSFMKQMRVSMTDQTKAILPVHIIGLELSLSHLPDDVIHAPGFGGEDGSAM